VRLALTITPGAIAVRYEDTASPFNPFAMTTPPDAEDDGDLERRKLGGLGVRLIRRMTQDLGYASPGGGNQVTFRLARSG
jgi:anti-sigma regulatory factor (Ser/Thr protein kinase)